MTYCTQDDLIDLFGRDEVVQLTDRDGDNDPDTAYLDQVLADTDAEMDAYLRVRYALPLSATPVRLRAVACDIARYRLYPLAVPEAVRQRYEDSRMYLKDVAAGRAELDLATPPDPSADAASPAYDAPDRVFSATTLDGY